MKLNKKKLISGIVALIGMIIMLVGFLGKSTYASVIVIAVGWCIMCAAIFVLEGKSSDAKIVSVVFVIIVVMALIMILANGLDINRPIIERQTPLENLLED